MATPHIAGVAALVIAGHPTFTSAQVRQRLETTATDLGVPGRDDKYGHGLVNALKAVNP
jgi:subtilisin family serine protease